MLPPLLKGSAFGSAVETSIVSWFGVATSGLFVPAPATVVAMAWSSVFFIVLTSVLVLFLQYVLNKS